MSNSTKSRNTSPATLFVVSKSSESKTNEEKFNILKKQYEVMLKRQEKQLQESEKLVEAVYG